LPKALSIFERLF